MNRDKMEILVGEETLTPLELFKKVKRSEDSSEYIQKIKKLMAYAVREELTPRQRECILLHFVHGYKQREISEKLGLCPSVVSRHIARGLRRLQRFLKYSCLGV